MTAFHYFLSEWRIKLTNIPMKPPSGLYPGEHPRLDRNTHYKATGEYRPPKAGEFYLSGAIITAHQAVNDLGTPYWIAKPVQMVTCPMCKGTGKVEK